jgi:hypothetical protein
VCYACGALHQREQYHFYAYAVCAVDMMDDDESSDGANCTTTDGGVELSGLHLLFGPY